MLNNKSLEEVFAEIQGEPGPSVQIQDGGFSFESPVPTPGEYDACCGLDAVNAPKVDPISRLVSAQHELGRVVKSLQEMKEKNPHLDTEELNDKADALFNLIGELRSCCDDNGASTETIMLSIPLGGNNV